LNRDVTNIAHDSRKVVPGSLFVAVRGFHSDGHLFVSQAMEKGAVAVIAEDGTLTGTSSPVPVVLVKDSRNALALIANAFYGHPSRNLKLIGVTGTNGKTTTTYLVKSILEAAGSSTGLIGTIDYRLRDKVYPAPNTTPESLDLQRLLAEMVSQGVNYCVMEVSSHALELGRTKGCTFSAAAFTNLTQDHLDFHETMDAYFRAKLRLFTDLAPDSHAVINIDDARGKTIIAATKATVITTGSTALADVRPVSPIQHGIHGLVFDVTIPTGMIHVESPLVGRHNIDNILTAIGLGIAMAVRNDDIATGIRSMKAVPGRMEKIVDGQPFGVIVDYAHTEDALMRLLKSVREIAAGHVITVFGCGGDRDRTKRPKMGAVAVQGSDFVIVTSDNPRSENPHAIVRDIEDGMTYGGQKVVEFSVESKNRFGKTPYQVIPDRRQAIDAAIQMARPGDVVVLAGKGHENYQIVGDKRIHFDDREVAREVLQKRR